jgi:hypothetical protein
MEGVEHGGMQKTDTAPFQATAPNHSSPRPPSHYHCPHTHSLLPFPLPAPGDAILEAELLQAFLASFLPSAKALVLLPPSHPPPTPTPHLPSCLPPNPPHTRRRCDPRSRAPPSFPRLLLRLR